MSGNTALAIVGSAFFAMIAAVGVFGANSKGAGEMSVECIKAGGQWISSWSGSSCQARNRDGASPISNNDSTGK